MSSVIAHSRSRRGPVALYAVAAVVVAVAVLALILGMQRPVEVTVDGAKMSIDRGTTIAKLAEQKAFSAPRGDLVSVKGKVLKKGQGGQPQFFVDGKPVASTQVVYAGDVVTSAAGKNVTEKTVIKNKPVAFKTVEKGTGPIGETVRPGVEGRAEVTVGEVSGVKVSSKVVQQPVSEVVQRRAISNKDKVVALTFDDGPWPGSTERILNILKKEDVKATFFMLGARARDMPKLARRVKAEGHLLGSHSLSHRYASQTKNLGVLKTQIVGGENLIEKVTGFRPVWYRPPGGQIDKRGWKIVNQQKLKVAMWDVDSRDWTRPGKKRIVHNVVANVDPGDIVLMHDGGGKRDQTVVALPEIIKQLKKKGYKFVTMDELASK